MFPVPVKVITDYTDSADVTVLGKFAVAVTEAVQITNYTDYTDSAEVAVPVQGRDDVTVTEAVQVLFRSRITLIRR